MWRRRRRYAEKRVENRKDRTTSAELKWRAGELHHEFEIIYRLKRRFVAPLARQFHRKRRRAPRRWLDGGATSPAATTRSSGRRAGFGASISLADATRNFPRPTRTMRATA